MNKAKQLYELQETDLDIEHKTETLTQLRSQLGKDDDLVSARAALDTARKHLTDLEHQQRTAEWGVEELGTKIAHEEKKLYEGSMKNPRELMSLQKEVEILKGQHGAQEEQLLTMMIEVDTAQQDVNLQRSELEVMERDWQENQKRLLREQTELEADLAALQQKREFVLGQTDSASLKVYEGLRQGKQGLAVAKVVQGGCQGCRISLPMSDQQRARMGHDLVTCSNCGRILYMD
jgi:predicted  nucleic acid-binding Zn-ribbon protein